MYRMIDVFLFTFERLRQHRILVFWTLVGLSAATTLSMSLLLYVDAVNTRLLTANLGNPPYGFGYRYLGSWEGNISQSSVEKTGRVIEEDFVGGMGLPVAQVSSYLSAGSWNFQREEPVTVVGAFRVMTLSGAESLIEISGSQELSDTELTEDTLPVLISENMLYKTGLQVGDTVTGTRSGKTVRLEIMGLWRAKDEEDPAWMFPPKFFDDAFLLVTGDFWTVVEGLEAPVEEAGWFVVFDGSDLRTADVPALLGNIQDGQRTVLAALPGIREAVSPEAGLQAFNEEVQKLTRQLVIVVLPVAGLILYFVSMLAGMLVGSQQQEDVTLSSRGMSRRVILGVHALMWSILAGGAFAVAAVVAPSIVVLIGKTTSFLRFTGNSDDLSVIYMTQALLATGVTGFLAASTGLWMAWRTTGQNITTYKRALARASHAWWQRLYLDMFMLLPAAYVLYTLQASGGISASAEEPFDDPLVFLAPTLFSLGVTLLFLRVFPFLLRSVAGVVTLGKDIALLMALRELTRSMARYRSALLMMCFTLSLIGFTASMASSLDRSLQDSIDYAVGADSVLVAAADTQTEESQNDSGETEVSVVGYNTLPATTLLQIEGVQQVSRVGRYKAQIVLARQRLDGTVMGIDRVAFTEIARFRADYADEPLADLLNRLAGNRNGLILDSHTAEVYNFKVGDEITLLISALGENYETKVPIVALVDYFPTFNPADGFFALTTLDPIFELVGTELPHDIWLSLAPEADLEKIKTETARLGFPILQWEDPQTRLAEAQADGARRGVLGFLSIGFVASIALTFVSSVIQSAASFRAQSIQIGTLRAMGLGGVSVASYLILSQGIAALSGVLGGTAIGLGTTLLYLPLLDFSGGLPPYLVRVSWDEIVAVYAIFAGLLVAITLTTTFFLGRQHVSTVVKLGDA